MPLQLDDADRRLLAGASAVLVLLVAAALLLVPAGDNDTEMPTSYSAASGGARAAYLLLKESGYRVARWERPPADLPEDGTGRLLVLAEPGTIGDERDIRAIATFVSTGGRVIVTGLGAITLVEDEAIAAEPWGGRTWQAATAASPSAITRAAPRITLAALAWSASPETALYVSAGKTRVFRQRRGAGEVIWWASPTPLTNAGLKEPGNIEFLLACVGDRESVSVLWDEYFHGYRASAVAAAVHSPIAWLIGQGALAGLVILLTFSRRSGPTIRPRDVSRLSPLEFARTLGGLYARARAASAAVEVCHTRFRHSLTRRLGMPVDTPVAELERALKERWAFSDANFRATLESCASVREHADVKPRHALRLVRALYGYAATLRLFDA